MKNAFDLVLRKAHVVPASDEMDCNIGITGGCIVALGMNLATGAREIPSPLRTELSH